MKNLSRLIRKRSKFRVSVEVFALVVMFFTFESTTSAAPSWSNNPDWAVEDESPAVVPKKTPQSAARENRPSKISPFSPGSNNVSLHLGQVFLFGELSDKYANNLGSRINYTYGVSEMFAFDASLGFSEHSEGAFSMTSLLTGLRTNLSWYDKVIPYVTGGLGFFRPSHRVQSTTIAPVLFGLHLGPGVDLEITKQFFFGTSLTFHDVFSTDKWLPDNTKLTIGGTYTSFFVRGGVTF